VALLPAPLAAANAVHKPSGVFVTVLAGSEWSDLCLFDGERLLGCRSVLAGHPESEGWADRITRELRPWLIGNEELQQIILLGNVTADTREALRQTTRLTVTEGDPRTTVRDPHGLLAELDGSPAAFATAIGLAQAALSRRQELNLLPRQIQEASHQQRKLAWASVGLLAAILLLTPLAITGQNTLQTRQAELARVQKQMHDARQTRGTAPGPAVMAAQQTVASLQKSESRPLEILRALSAELPAGIGLTNFSYERGKAVVLQGRADSNIVLAEAMTVINRQTMFAGAILNYSNLVKSATEHGYDFQITCTLPPGSDLTLGPAKPQRPAAPQKGAPTNE
jgi:hypothetical protein